MQIFFVRSLRPAVLLTTQKFTSLTCSAKRWYVLLLFQGFLRWNSFNWTRLFYKISHLCIFCYLIQLPIWVMHFVTFSFIMRVVYWICEWNFAKALGGKMSRRLMVIEAASRLLSRGARGKNVPSFDGDRSSFEASLTLCFPMHRGRLSPPVSSC